MFCAYFSGMTTKHVVLPLAAVLACSLGCGEDDSGAGPNAAHVGNEVPMHAAMGVPAGPATAPSGGMPAGNAAQPDGDDRSALPPEMEVELDFQRPQASERFVYAANPDGGTVAVINAMTREIQTIETGRRPTFLRTLAGTDDAIVLNTGDDEATLIHAGSGEGEGERGRLPTTENVPVIEGANAIEVAPDGNHAVIYFDAERAGPGDGFGDLQTVSVLSFGDGQAKAKVHGMSVGFKPRQVAFRQDSERAYVVTENGISVLDFKAIDEEGSSIADTIAFDTGTGNESRDVSITPDGKYAVARTPGQSTVSLVTLDSGQVTVLDLTTVYEPTDEEIAAAEQDDDGDAGVAGAADGGLGPVVESLDVTDLDISRDGAFAAAVLRDRSAVMRIPLPGGFEDPSAIDTTWVEDQIVGQVVLVPTGELALLYTTAVQSESMSVVDLSGDKDTRVVDLRKTVQGVAISDDGRTALIIHSRKQENVNEPGISFDERVDRSFGYSLLRPSTGDVKLELTDIAPGPYVLVPSGDYLFMTFRNDPMQIREVQRVELETFLVNHPAFKLGSPPVSIGVVPTTGHVFVSQEHPEGRMTFIPWTTIDPKDVDTVTGFELNSRIRD